MLPVIKNCLIIPAKELQCAGGAVVARARELLRVRGRCMEGEKRVPDRAGWNKQAAEKRADAWHPAAACSGG